VSVWTLIEQMVGIAQASGEKGPAMREVLGRVRVGRASRVTGRVLRVETSAAMAADQTATDCRSSWWSPPATSNNPSWSPLATTGGTFLVEVAAAPTLDPDDPLARLRAGETTASLSGCGESARGEAAQGESTRGAAVRGAPTEVRTSVTTRNPAVGLIQ